MLLPHKVIIYYIVYGMLLHHKNILLHHKQTFVTPLLCDNS